MEREVSVMGVLITLYPMKNLIKESKMFGTYTNNMFAHTYPKIEVVSIEEILNGTRMKVPIALEVLKSAAQKAQNIQSEMGF